MGMTTDMGIRPGMHTFSMTAGLGDIGTGRARQMEAVEKAKGKNEGGGQANRIPFSSSCPLDSIASNIRQYMTFAVLLTGNPVP